MIEQPPFGWLFGLVGGFAIGFGMAEITGDLPKFRAEAVELGAAEWVVDPKTGETTFRWKEVRDE